MKCAVCHRKAKGYGWFNPRVPRSDPSRHNDKWVFCSRPCQEAFSKLMNKTEGQMIDPSDMEIAAMQSCLGPLGEYVGSIGMQRPLADYSRDEVLMLIDVVVTRYQDSTLWPARDGHWTKPVMVRIGGIPSEDWVRIEPTGFVAPLVGREWSHGVLDC